ncbi:hypothetical protein Fmac_024614 [Flemingia macrophylla]|uniref:pectinesterase n=1 Tax=Flemingia macrophylla TaxID=520843 RepID=A0ABD1LPY1_9FABA
MEIFSVLSEASLVAIAVTTLCFLFAVFSLLRSYSLPRRFTPPRKYHCDCASNSDSALNGGMLEPSPVLTPAPLAERRTGSSMMEELVPEITTHALSYLDYPSLCRLSMTNSSMRKAANDDNAWKALYHKDFTLEQDSVTPTNGWKAYYAATRAIMNINTEFFNIVRDKSLPAMSRFWLNADYVKCIHASGELFSGCDACMLHVRDATWTYNVLGCATCIGLADQSTRQPHGITGGEASIAQPTKPRLEMVDQEDAQTKRRLIIIGVSTIFLVVMVIAITVGVNINMVNVAEEEGSNDSKPYVISTMKAVKTICKPTDYRKECEKSLRAEAGNTTDARELIKIAFNITIKKISNGVKKTDLMKEIEKDPRAKMALDTCKQLMDLSIGEFKRSLERMRSFDLDNLDYILNSLKVWLSAAITYQETCLDGFDHTKGEGGKKMRSMLMTTMHMSSNALAIITELASTVNDINSVINGHRRLLGDSRGERDGSGHGDDDEVVPYWADNGGVRRFLNAHSKPQQVKPDVVVAKDGSGKYRSINKALLHVPKGNKKPFVIYIKEGVYHEYVEVKKNMTHVLFVGDGGKKTRITGNRNFVDGVTTYRTPTVAIQGDYFAAINIGFENTAGPHKHQAVAIRVQADKSIFYKCTMEGYQDTLYAHAMRQFYRDCTISGTIDFVFGDALAVFQNCTFLVRKPMENQKCIVTAQGRKERHQPSGIVIQGGSIVSEHKGKFDSKAYLARPWKNYSRTIFMDTYIGDLIQPDGYLPWQGPNGNTGMSTCFYAEYNNFGPGSNMSNRVKWRGIKTLDTESATRYLPYQFFHGDDWIKVSRVPYDAATTLVGY